MKTAQRVTNAFFRHRPGNRGSFHLALGVHDDTSVVLKINSDVS